MMRLGPIDILRFSLAGILLLLGGIWKLSVAIVRWTLFVLLWAAGYALIMCGIVLLFCSGPIGIGLLIFAGFAALGWCLKEDY
jgi:hypothetical protein